MRTSVPFAAVRTAPPLPAVPLGIALPAAALLLLVVLQRSFPWRGDREELLILAGVNAVLALLAVAFFHLRWLALRDRFDVEVRTVLIPVAVHFVLLLVVEPFSAPTPALEAVIGGSWICTQALAALLLIHAFWTRPGQPGFLRASGALGVGLAVWGGAAGLGLALRALAPGSSPRPLELGLGALFLAAAVAPFRRARRAEGRELWLGSSLMLAAAAHFDLAWSSAPFDNAFMWSHALFAFSLATPLAGAVRENVRLLNSKTALADELRVLRNRTQILLDTLPVIVFTVDRGRQLRYANRRATLLLDAATGGSTAKPTTDWLQRIHREDRARFEAAIPEILAGNQSQVSAVVRLVEPQGIHWLSAELHPVLDPLDGDELVEVVASDITDLVCARQASEASQARLAFLSSVAQTVAGEVAEGRILDRFLEIGQVTFSVECVLLLRARPAGDLLRLVSTRGTEMAGRDLWHESVRADNPCWLAFRDGVPRFSTPRQALPHEAAVRLETERDVKRLVAVPLLAAGQVFGVLALATPDLPDFAADDVDLFTQVGILLGGAIHFSQLVVQLEEQRALALEASRLKSEFLANTSHELRTPLTSILGFLRLVINGAVDEPTKQREFLSIAHESGEKLLTIINDVLDLARIEAGRLEVFQAPVPVRQLVRDVEQLFRHQMRSKGVALQVADESSHRAVWADPHRTLQILTNLLGNALKFTPSGGTVTLRTGGDAREVLFTVEDNGIGIPRDELDRVFTPFYQLDGTSTRHYGGAGLGLTISRRLAELMGGSLSLQSLGEERGTRAELRLGVYHEPGPAGVDG